MIHEMKGAHRDNVSGVRQVNWTRSQHVNFPIHQIKFDDTNIITTSVDESLKGKRLTAQAQL